MREAYLHAAEETPGRNSAEWIQFVSRIVLFASVNRGIVTRRILWLRFVAWLARNVPILSSLRVVDLYRGSSFLTNLRIKWIRYFGSLAEDQDNGEKWPNGRKRAI